VDRYEELYNLATKLYTYTIDLIEKFMIFVNNFGLLSKSGMDNIYLMEVSVKAVFYPEYSVIIPIFPMGSITNWKST